MTKDELIAKQQLEIEEYKRKSKENKEILKTLHYRINGIGQPLNDNMLRMDIEQIRWVHGINQLIESIEV